MRVAVKGVGITKFGELWNKSLDDLIENATDQAIKSSGIGQDKIDAVFIGNMLYGSLSNQEHLGALVTSILNINAPAFRIEGACASGGLAIHLAASSILSGQYKNILVVGAEKMTDFPANEISRLLMGAGAEDERLAGLTFPGLYALLAKAHMQEFGTSSKQLAAVSSKNHYHASLNENAQYPFDISIDKVLESSFIAEPLTLLDCSPITDGAAAVVLSSEINKNDVLLKGSAVATDTLSLADRESLTELKATRLAAEKAYKQAGINVKDVSVAEVHDCFTIAEILALEDLGFCKKGEGGKFVESGVTKIGGKTPINTSGGLKACGHPVGATGVKQIAELTLQLKGQAGKRQVEKPKVALAQNVGGTGATVVISILQV